MQRHDNSLSTIIIMGIYYVMMLLNIQIFVKCSDYLLKIAELQCKTFACMHITRLVKIYFQDTCHIFNSVLILDTF